MQGRAALGSLPTAVHGLLWPQPHPLEVDTPALPPRVHGFRGTWEQLHLLQSQALAYCTHPSQQRPGEAQGASLPLGVVDEPPGSTLESPAQVGKGH